MYIITKKSFKTKDIKYLYKNKNVYIFMHVKTKKAYKKGILYEKIIDKKLTIFYIYFRKEKNTGR